LSGGDAKRQLDALLDAAREDGRLAIDTEFMGEGRYRTLLCLIQLAVADSDADDETLIVDPLDEDFDGRALADVLADPEIEIVLHAGRQDVALLKRVLQTEVTNIFDTQLAAGFAGMAAQASYDSLLHEVLSLKVAKSASFTRWDQRPLSSEQLEYAREDVLHLLEMADELQRRLAGLGRLEWAREECRALSLVSDEREPAAIFERLPRVNSLNAGARTVARELVAWRERTAERQDRPVQSVLSDAGLVEIAKRRPASREQLSKLRGIGAVAQGRRADDVLGVVERARGMAPDAAPELPRTASGRPEDAPLIALSEALVRARAREAGLAYELLAARADLQAIVASVRAGEAPPDVRTMRGWRRELVGEQVLDLLAGRVALSVDVSRGRRKLSVEDLADDDERG
jgi:ribonuclease D